MFSQNRRTAGPKCFLAASWHHHHHSPSLAALTKMGARSELIQGTAPKSVVFGPGAVGRNPKLDKVTALSVAMTGLGAVGSRTTVWTII